MAVGDGDHVAGREVRRLYWRRVRLLQSAYAASFLLASQCSARGEPTVGEQRQMRQIPRIVWGASRPSAACPQLWLALAVLAGILHGTFGARGDEPSPENSEIPLDADDYDHWAFRPLERPSLPSVRNPDWSRHPLDRFVQALHEQRQVTPANRAADRTLLRRLTYDLTGLPPSQDDIGTFAADSGPDRIARLADRLLAAPTYGEHAARFWLDLARFAETDGFEHDLPRPDAWRYRDWVIAAWNADLPFDQFVQLQIAGDLLAPNTPDGLIATGFLLAGPDMPDLNLADERRHVVLNELTGAVSAVFLGLQMGCAECHDHKTDPISQADFYRLRAHFDSLELFRPLPLPGSNSPNAMARAVKQDASRVSHLYLRGDFRHPGPVVRPAPPRIAERFATSRDKTLPPRVESGTATAQAIDASPSAARLALAKWLTAPDRPLFSRVAVNRIWQEHFGSGLVESSSDFGLLGDLPSHPELLDWLADEWPRQGWSVKRLRRDIVLSATYQQASGGPSVDSARQRGPTDSANRLLRGQNRRRLTGESLRDALLAVSGTLNRTPGGPGVRPPLPPEVVATLLKKQWDESPDARDHHRRSVYVFVRRNLPFPIFAAFDRPDRNATCPARGVSTTAPQSLVLWNSDFAVSSAEALAAEVLGAANQTDARLEVLFERALTRRPTDSERTEASTWLAERSESYRRGSRRGGDLGLAGGRLTARDPAVAAAWVDLCRTLLNLNEFLYID